jgi:hypothetical protein
MKLTNDSYRIRLSGKTWTEHYRRDRQGWLKVSARGRRFRLTAEQVLNHLLPALAGLKPNLNVKVTHRNTAPKPRQLAAKTHPRGG